MLLTDANRLIPGYLKAAEELRDNPDQWQAYNSKENCVVLAGPGSGKTKTLTIKMARIIAVDITMPQGVACITYSTECARELQRRLERLGVRRSRNIFVGTLHGFCLQHIVRPYGKLAGIPLPSTLTVASASDRRRALEFAVAKVISANEDPSWWETRLQKYRRTHLDRDAVDWTEDTDLASLIEHYEKFLLQKDRIDFDDMVLIGLRLVEQFTWVRKAIKARFPVVIVDEYQDLGLPLHRIVTTLCLKAGVRLIAVGDPDQSIYGFTGAQPELIKELLDLPHVEPVRLQFNYRSGKTIVDASEIALGEERGYRPKGKTKGTIDFYEFGEGPEAEARGICDDIIPEALKRKRGRKLGDIAVLYLTKHDGDIIGAAAERAGYQYVRIDQGAAYPRTPLIRWLEECAEWCANGWKVADPKLADLTKAWQSFNPSVRSDSTVQDLRLDLVRFLLSNRTPDRPLSAWLTGFKNSILDNRIDLEPTLNDEKEPLQRLTTAADAGGKLAQFTVNAFAGQGGTPDHLNLITLHSAKGLEFEVVIMMGMDQGRIPPFWAKSAEAKTESRRLFYVGLTRAKDEVHMTYVGWSQNKYGTRFLNGPSEFLLEVQQKLES